MKRIVLFKEWSADYQEILGDYSVEFIKVLDFEFINSKELKDKLNNEITLICTSQNALKALSRIGSFGNNVFVVGEKSARIASSMGLNPMGSASGNAKNLTKLIIASECKQKLLWLRGNLADTNTIIPELRNAGLNIEDLIVYNTKPIQVDPVHNAVLVIFSPSTLSCINLRECTNCEFVAIGPTTGKALNDLNIPFIAAKTPSPKGVLDAVLLGNIANI